MAALETIDAKLRRAKAVYDNAVRLGTPNDRRLALGFEIAALVDLINLFDPWREAELASPLIGLLTAFMSLEKGAAEKLFEQDAPPGPPALVSASLFRGYAAAAAAVLIRVGSTEKFADEWVADRLHAAGYRKTGERGDKTQITG